VQELLHCGNQIADIIYVGTSGWSPQNGGVLSVIPYERELSSLSGSSQKLPTGSATVREGGCESANPSRAVNRIGDVCLSSGSVNWACKMAKYTEECGWNDDACFLPG